MQKTSRKDQADQLGGGCVTTQVLGAWENFQTEESIGKRTNWPQRCLQPNEVPREGRRGGSLRAEAHVLTPMNEAPYII